jgi:hypothetical protein
MCDMCYMPTPYMPHAIAICCMLLSTKTGLKLWKTRIPEYPEFWSNSGIIGIPAFRYIFSPSNTQPSRRIGACIGFYIGLMSVGKCKQPHHQNF